MKGTAEDRVFRLGELVVLGIVAGLIVAGAGLVRGEQSVFAVGVAFAVASVILMVTVAVVADREGWLA